jgi:hypothetical protein
MDQIFLPFGRSAPRLRSGTGIAPLGKRIGYNLRLPWTLSGAEGSKF